jgi:hypothetical protein
MDVTFSDGTRERYEDRPWKQGTQGVIFRSLDGQHLVKLFINVRTPAGIAQRQQQVDKIIGEYNVVRGDPYWSQLFTWPDKRVVMPGLGVRMRFAQGMTTVDHYFFPQAFARLRPEQKGWWIGRVAVAIKMARAVHRLSSRGLCHSDLSERNVLVDPLEGRLTILDCDSLVVPGVLPPDVLGTKEYMAPELMSGRAKWPSTETDRHALAVLLYRWLLYRHPLIGPKQHHPDPDVDERLALGDRALYAEHPSDASNRPRGRYVAADTLTPRLHDLFQQAFVEGLHAPGRRPLPEYWEHALLELFDRIVPCANPGCEQKFFAAPEARPLRCPLCGTPLQFPGYIPFLKLRRPARETGSVQFSDEGRYAYYVVGWPERALYAWHADPSATPAPDASGRPADDRPCAIFRFDAPSGEWYLYNAGLPDLALTAPEGQGEQAQPIALGSYAPLKHNTRLLLGRPSIARAAYVELRKVG